MPFQIPSPTDPALPAPVPANASTRPTVAIVGGGFSGLLTALHLVGVPDGPQVRLFERRPVFARGAAFATDNPDHLLNVRVGNMSAFPDQPEHFKDWLCAHGGWRAHGEFVTRAAYGAYLQDLLRTATRTAPPGRLLLYTDEIVDARPDGPDWSLTTAMGRRLAAQALILATGLLPPAAPPQAEPALLASRRYIADPWASTADLGGLGERVLLLGAGLTMVDVALTLRRPGRRLIALSRRGLAPRAHAPFTEATLSPPRERSPLDLLRWVRRASRDGDWRAAIDALRPHVQDVWGRWSLPQRRMFLRHLRPWWDAHRHRLAPAVARSVEAMQAEGALTIDAGRLSRLALSGERVALSWISRGGRIERSGMVDAVVNCTGPRGDLGAVRDSLLGRLLAAGLIRPDPCGLGAEIDRLSRPLNSHGEPTPGLFSVGPLGRGAFWEITSVPDIRLQVQEVAATVAGSLGVRPVADA